jgi:hypothetical protein
MKNKFKNRYVLGEGRPYIDDETYGVSIGDKTVLNKPLNPSHNDFYCCLKKVKVPKYRLVLERVREKNEK